MFRAVHSSIFLSIGVLFFVAGGTAIAQQEAVAQWWGHTDSICAWAHEGNRTSNCSIQYHCVQDDDILPAAYPGHWREDDKTEKYQACFDLNNADCHEQEGTQDCLLYEIFDAAGCHASDYVDFSHVRVPKCQ